jgi:hypothetical protein
MVRCRDATASSFVAIVRGEVFAHFYAVAVKLTVVCEIDCSVCHDEFFANNPLVVKENDEHTLYSSPVLLLFRSRWVWAFRVRLMLSSPKACLIIARVSVALFSRFLQDLMLFLCRIHCESHQARYMTPYKRT